MRHVLNAREYEPCGLAREDLSRQPNQTMCKSHNYTEDDVQIGGRMMRRAVGIAKVLFIALILCSAANAAEKQDSDNWPMYGRNLHHTFTNPHSLITPENVATLQEAWVFPTRDVVSASPAVVHSVLYTGSWDGYFYALDAHTGQLN